MRTTAQWKRWFERREGKKKKKSGKKAAVRQKVQAQESAIPMSGLSLPGVVSESTFLAGSPGRSRILEIADRLRKNLSLPFIPSIAETLEFCITTGYPFRHA